MIAFFAAAPATPPAIVYVRAGHLFDGTGDAFRDDVVIRVEDGKIASVTAAASASIPAGAKVVDLSKQWVLPGLIDCHTHLSFRSDRYDPIYDFKDTPVDNAIAGVKNAKTTLDAGFTTVRELGSAPFVSVSLRDRIEEGFIEGPRIVASGPGISITGGHGDLNGYSPAVSVMTFPQERDFAIADGADQVRHVVRAQMKYGVDVIKILASGGVLSHGDSPGAPQYTLDELKVAAETAHSGGRKIAAHAHGAQSIRMSIEAGIDSIEHGSFIDDEGIRMAKAKNTFVIFDIYDGHFLVDHAGDIGLPLDLLTKAKDLVSKKEGNVRKAVKAGVRVAFGTDAGVYPHGENAKNFRYLVGCGMTPAQAIRAATSEAAELLGREDVGRVAPGRFADLVAVDADPLKDITVLEHVSTVVKAGAIVTKK
jgi:imidazolonepropionase-like amidohydrolase